MPIQEENQVNPVFIDSNEPLELPIFVTREPVSQAKLNDPQKSLDGKSTVKNGKIHDQQNRMVTLEGRNQ